MSSKNEWAWYSSWLQGLFSLVKFQPKKKNHVDNTVQQYLNISKSEIPHFLTNKTSLEKRVYFRQCSIGLMHGLCL